MTNNVNNYLELPAIYTGGWNQVNLQYYRWLNVMSGDRAYITANDIVVWDNFSYAVSELEWFRQIVDITPAASGCDSIVIRFRLHTNASGMDGGWNIDDIMVSRDVFVSVDDEKQLPVPEQFRLYQNYPNPFNPATTITFDIPKPQLIKLAVYNVLGQKVKILVSTSLPAGTYRFIWQGDNTHGEKVAGGVYFMRLTGQNQQSTKKLLLVR